MNLQPTNYNLKPKNGFTLAEMLVVISIFALLMIMIFSIYILSQRAYYTSDTKAEIDQNGRIALDRMSREIRQAKEIVTALPETDDDQDFPPANEIEFQNGHISDDINYIRYYIKNGNELWRQVKFYYFNPPGLSIHVNWKTKDEYGSGPTPEVIEDKLVAEYIETLQFYEPDAINIYAVWQKNGHYLYLNTKIFGRNLR